MRIAVITNAFPPEARGGAGVIASDLVDLWREDGHEVRVWTEYASWLKRGILMRLFGHVFLDRRAGSCVSEIRAWNPNVVVTHNLTGIGWGTGRALKTPTRKWIHVLHDVQMFEPSGQMRDDRVTLWQRCWAWYRRQLFGEPTSVVSPTKWLLEAHQRRGFTFSHAHVIQNPAPKATVSKNKDKSGAWLFVGRLSEDKGADAFYELAQACPEERFACIGDGPWQKRLSTLKNVTCFGAQPREMVQKTMAKSRGVLVLSRLMENQPTVILEAFTAGIPVIATPMGGIPETVGNGGVVVRWGLRSWKDAIQEIKKNESLWREKIKTMHLKQEKTHMLWQRTFEEF
ncbi:glycosyltransferase [Patescibacteria group bacterium]|nr:glycosyltransferase [Patescibacteria group bacterium]